MSKDMENVKEKKPKKTKMTMYIIILAALFIAELYLMINRPTDYLVLGVVGLVMLCFVYWIIDLGFKLQNEKDTKSEKEYENLFKSQRMSYLLMKENFEDMYVILKEIEDNSDIPIEDLIEAQKAVAKVTIHRSKENANALMNSNDKMIERMLAFEEKLNAIEKAMEEKQLSGIDEMTDKVLGRQQEIISSISVMENAIKDEIRRNYSGAVALVSESDTLNDNIRIEEEEIRKEVVEETVEIPEEVVEETVEIPEEVVEETVEEVAEEMPISNDPNHVMTPEEIARLIGEVNEEPESEPEPVEEEKTTMPDLSDPNHVMTPDEIAALLANM